MVVNFLDARDVLGRDSCCLPGSFLGNDAAKVHDAVTHGNAERNRQPVVLLDGREDTVSDMVVIGGRVWHIASKTGDRLKDWRVSQFRPVDLTQYGKAFDVVLFHHVDDLLERGVFRHGKGLRYHDFCDLASLLMHEVSRSPTRTDPAALPLRSRSRRNVGNHPRGLCRPVY